jgi:hypothetical protein
MDESKSDLTIRMIADIAYHLKALVYAGNAPEVTENVA